MAGSGKRPRRRRRKNSSSYGMTGSHDDVPSDVFDAPFAFEGGAMVMETDLDLNGPRIVEFATSPLQNTSFLQNMRKENTVIV